VTGEITKVPNALTTGGGPLQSAITRIHGGRTGPAPIPGEVSEQRPRVQRQSGELGA